MLLSNESKGLIQVMIARRERCNALRIVLAASNAR